MTLPLPLRNIDLRCFVTCLLNNGELIQLLHKELDSPAGEHSQDGSGGQDLWEERVSTTFYRAADTLFARLVLVQYPASDIVQLRYRSSTRRLGEKILDAISTCYVQRVDERASVPLHLPSRPLFEQLRKFFGRC